jgi:hypothetical protein
VDNLLDKVRAKLKEGIDSKEDYLKHVKRKYDDKWLNGTVIDTYDTPYPEYPKYCKGKLESHHKVDLPFYVYGFCTKDFKEDDEVQVILFFNINKIFIKKIREV